MARCIGITRRGEKCNRLIDRGQFCARHQHQEGKCLVNYHTHAKKCANEPLKNGYCEEHQHHAKGLLGVELNELSIAGKLLAGVFAMVIALSAFTMVSLLIQRNGV